MVSFNTKPYDKTSTAYNMMSPVLIDGSNSVPMSGTQYYNGLFGNVMAGFCVDGLDSVLGGNVIITGDVSCCAGLAVNGNVYIGGNTTFDINLPTSSLVPSSANQLTNKTYVDSQVATKTTLAGVQSNNNVFTGTTSFNTSLPTSTLVPSTANQLTNKTYVDTKTTLAIVQSNNNAFTGTMTVTGDANFTSCIGLRTDGVQSIYMTDTVGQYSTSNNSYCRMFATGPNAYVDFYGTRIWRNTLATGIVSGGQVMKLGSTGNLQISGGLTTGGATQMNGSLAVTGTTNFDSVLPTSILTPANNADLSTKKYVDDQVAPKTTLATVLANNNTWTGTQYFSNVNAVLCNALQAFNTITASTLAVNILKVGSYSENITGMSCGTTAGTTNGTKTVNFGIPFAHVPVVTATANYGGIGYILSVMVIGVNTTSFQYNLLNLAGSTPAHFEQFSGINWIAIGKQ
jgi:hypothetical protein